MEKSLLLRRRRSPEDAVTMRESPEPADDVGVMLGVFQVFCNSRIAKKLDAAFLIGQMLRMHQRRTEELA